MKSLTTLVLLLGVLGGLVALRGALSPADDVADPPDDLPRYRRVRGADAPGSEPTRPETANASGELEPPGKLPAATEERGELAPVPARQPELLMVAPDGSPIRRLPTSGD